jgi:hypothetical protein
MHVLKRVWVLQVNAFVNTHRMLYLLLCISLYHNLIYIYPENLEGKNTGVHSGILSTFLFENILSEMFRVSKGNQTSLVFKIF